MIPRVEEVMQDMEEAVEVEMVEEEAEEAVTTAVVTVVMDAEEEEDVIIIPRLTGNPELAITQMRSGIPSPMNNSNG